MFLDFEGSRTLASRSSERTTLGTLWVHRSVRWRPVLLTHWPAVMCIVSVIIKRFLCSSVGVISPQDAVTAERDVIENYHLHRPRALECSPAGSPISPQEEEGGETKAQIES